MLKRKSELKADPAKTREWQRRSKPLKRGKPLAKIGRKTEREKPALDAFREALRERSNGMCEAPLGCLADDGRYIEVPHTSARFPHAGVDPHHVWPEDRDCGVHDPDRGLWLCRVAHDWCDANPTDAKIVGLLRPESGVPYGR